MSEDVLISTTWLDGLRWPSTCVRCGASIGADAPGAPFAVPACRHHARSEAVARWILSPSPGVLALRVPVFLGSGWLLRFVATTLHTHADWSTALADVEPLTRAWYVYALAGAIALLWAERTASLTVTYPDAARRRTLLRFRRPDEAREFRALNPDFVIADGKPTPWWLRDSPALVLALVAAIAIVLEEVHSIRAH